MPAACATCSRSVALARDEIVHSLDLAQFYVREPGDLPARDGALLGRTVANLFFEPSTRTRVSFELAATRLGADVVNLDLHSSSRVKGETVLDTIYTLQAMMVDVFVMRDSDSIYLEDGKLLSQQEYPGEQFVIRIQAPQCAAAALPGSFAHLTCDPERPMRRPLSLMRVDAMAGSRSCCVVGPGLEALV
ncbi:MAG: hypothetical protein IPJ97_04590 [Proteobacteria bacterium]|nr:hypothetical protein [Pseudomonadota bacterium]